MISPKKSEIVSFLIAAVAAILAVMIAGYLLVGCLAQEAFKVFHRKGKR